MLLLAPDVLELAETVYDNFEPISAAVFDGDDPAVLDDIKAQYKKVGKEYDQAKADVETSKNAVISLIDLVKRLTQGKTSKNSKVVTLVSETAELVRQRLLVTQAQQKNAVQLQGLTAALQGEDKALALGASLKVKMQSGAVASRAAGLDFIRLIQGQADRLHRLVFYAQRPVEIYILTDQSQAVRYDCGFIHPDVEARYRDARAAVTDNDLVTAYAAS